VLADLDHLLAPLCSWIVAQKQRLRDNIQPGISLGHSDKK